MGLSHSPVLLLQHPESPLYGLVNQHLLKAEGLQLGEVALAGRLVHASTPGAWREEQMWALCSLWPACRVSAEH